MLLNIVQYIFITHYTFQKISFLKFFVVRSHFLKVFNYFNVDIYIYILNCIMGNKILL